MKNVDLSNIENWRNIKKLYESNDKESWLLADTILEQTNIKYKNQVSALLKVIPQDRSGIDTADHWLTLVSNEIEVGTNESVQMLADIYCEYLKKILFDDSIWNNFDIKLIYNGRKE